MEEVLLFLSQLFPNKIWISGSSDLCSTAIDNSLQFDLKGKWNGINGSHKLWRDYGKALRKMSASKVIVWQQECLALFDCYAMSKCFLPWAYVNLT